MSWFIHALIGWGFVLFVCYLIRLHQSKKKPTEFTYASIIISCKDFDESTHYQIKAKFQEKIHQFNWGTLRFIDDKQLIAMLCFTHPIKDTKIIVQHIVEQLFDEITKSCNFDDAYSSSIYTKQGCYILSIAQKNKPNYKHLSIIGHYYRK